MSHNVGDAEPTYDTSKVHEALGLCDDDETLRCLYTEYSERLRNRGAHIWTTATVFIPLSISGVIAIGSVANGPLVWALASGSILLIWIWFFISEQMRIGLERHRFACAALETAMLKHKPPLDAFGLGGLLVSSTKAETHLIHSLTLRKIRVIIASAITFLWLVIGILFTILH